MATLFLFDIDGTILTFRKYKSREIFSDMIHRVFQKKVNFRDLPSFAGMTDLQILRHIADSIDHPFDDIKRRLEHVWADMLPEFERFSNKEHIVLMPGIEELLSFLDSTDDVYLGLCTGNFRENAYLKLRAYDLHDHFPFGAFGSDHEDRNMLPPIAIERGNAVAGKDIFNTENTIIVGDSPRDIECAKANNMHCISVSTGYFGKEELSELSPEILVEDFSDIQKTKDIFKNYID